MAVDGGGSLQREWPWAAPGSPLVAVLRDTRADADRRELGGGVVHSGGKDPDSVFRASLLAVRGGPGRRPWFPCCGCSA